uniref:Uncharacterized protein n=1 Tax=Rhizophora mucronata TaxID=61149 RepID=A0A2P2QSW6_RHIMU
MIKHAKSLYCDLKVITTVSSSKNRLPRNHRGSKFHTHKQKNQIITED